jgi:hypothetical protein
VLKSKTQPAVIIKPKQADRSAVDTKRNINEKINPIEVQLSISKVKNIKDRVVLMGFSSKKDNAVLKRLHWKVAGKIFSIKSSMLIFHHRISPESLSVEF